MLVADQNHDQLERRRRWSNGWLEPAIDRVERHLEAADLRGWDPYDALCSPLFRLPVLRSSHLLRFGSQQALKRMRWNLRPALRIPKSANPVTIGLYVQGQAQRAASGGALAPDTRANVQRAVARLADAVSPGYSGSCWGYPFDWETRSGSIPAHTPTIVATGMVGNGLWAAYQALGVEEAARLMVSAADFVLRDLRRIQAGDGSFCWSYAPRGNQAVLNATLKGSRLLGQVYALGGPDELLEPAGQSVRFAIAHQRPSGAWPYSLSDNRVDNFHTGYVLECLSSYRRLSGDDSVGPAIDRGWTYYRDHLFTSNLTPKYYDDRVEPLDATACAQAIITLCEFGDVSAAARVAEHAVDVLGMPDGSFAYQRRGQRVVRTPFLRWSTAWMYCALTRLAQEIERTPVSP